MRLNRDCASFEEGGAPPIVHHGPDGVFSEPGGRCRRSMIDLGGCPVDCPYYHAA